VHSGCPAPVHWVSIRYVHDVAPDLKPPASSRGNRLVRLAVVAAGLVVAAAVAIVVIALRPHQSQPTAPRVSGIPASVPTSLGNLMSLTPVPGQAAPAFTLTDQAGRTLSLASLKGRVVVLEFMDPHCTDICPIVSKEFIDAYHDLGSAASHMVFLGPWCTGSTSGPGAQRSPVGTLTVVNAVSLRASPCHKPGLDPAHRTNLWSHTLARKRPSPPGKGP
jgi:AhpC/TSA family